MNLRRNRNRRRDLLLALGAVLILSTTGFLREEADAEPLGRRLIQKLQMARDSDPQPGEKLTGHAGVTNDQYTIGPADVLQISVWHEPEISGPVSVRPDGNISMPLIGDLKVSGLTPTKLQGTLKEKLRAFISDPEVSVTVQQVKSKNFNVLGEVQHPGSYPLAHSVSVLDAISMAGGFRDFAKVTKIYVLRKTSDGATIHIPFNYKQVVKGNRADQNVELNPEDTVVVP
jgi:polysaccharide biosynthesis/export protein